MTNYERGVALERDVLVRLRARGYLAMRTAGSHGPIDVVGIGPAKRGGLLLLIQCRTERGSMSVAEGNALLMLADGVGGTAMLADRSGIRRTPLLYRITRARDVRQPFDGAAEVVEWDDLP